MLPCRWVLGQLSCTKSSLERRRGSSSWNTRTFKWFEDTRTNQESHECTALKLITESYIHSGITSIHSKARVYEKAVISKKLTKAGRQAHEAIGDLSPEVWSQSAQPSPEMGCALMAKITCPQHYQCFNLYGLGFEGGKVLAWFLSGCFLGLVPPSRHEMSEAENPD